MTNLKTPFARHPYLVLLVGLPEALARECAAAVVPTPTLRVDTAAGLEKIPQLKPLVVVVQASPAALAAEVNALRVAAKTASASFVDLAQNDGRSLEARLRAAVEESEAARAVSSRH